MNRESRIVKVLLIGAFFGLLLFLAACDMSTNMDLEDVHERMNTPEGCFVCYYFRVIYNMLARLSGGIYPVMCNSALSVLALGFFGWILWHVLGLITSMREPNIAQFWVQFFQKFFKVGFVAILIASKERVLEVIDSVMVPIALLFISLGRSIIDSNWISVVSTNRVFTSGIQSGPGFSSDVGLQLENLIYRVTIALNSGRVLGLRMMLSDDFANFWLGLMTVVIFFLMTLFFPFYLLDGLIRLAFVFMLLPFFLVAWCFKFSASYFTKAWAIFLGAFAQILAACVFVSLCIATFEGFVSIRGFGHLLSPTVQNIDRILYNDAGRMSLSFLSFVLVAFYMYDLSKRITSVTAYFTGAPSSSIMAGAIERVKQAAKAIALTAVAVTASAVGLAPVAQVAADQAKDSAKKAAT